jgi:hypothetical protein
MCRLRSDAASVLQSAFSLLQCCGSGSGSSILRVRIQGLDDQILKKIQLEKITVPFLIKNAIYFSLGPLKDVQATGEAFNPRKKTSSSSKNEFIKFFLFLWVIFDFRDPNPQQWVQAVLQILTLLQKSFATHSSKTKKLEVQFWKSHIKM